MRIPKTFSLDEEFIKLFKEDWRHAKNHKMSRDEAERYKQSHHLEHLLKPILEERERERKKRE